MEPRINHHSSAARSARRVRPPEQPGTSPSAASARRLVATQPYFGVEARALRVVVSDLPTRFSREVERCLTATNGTSNSNGSSTALARCIDILSALIGESEVWLRGQFLAPFFNGRV